MLIGSSVPRRLTGSCVGDVFLLVEGRQGSLYPSHVQQLYGSSNRLSRREPRTHSFGSVLRMTWWCILTLVVAVVLVVSVSVAESCNRRPGEGNDETPPFGGFSAPFLHAVRESRHLTSKVAITVRKPNNKPNEIGNHRLYLSFDDRPP